MPSNHMPKKRKPDTPPRGYCSNDQMPGWAVDRILDLKTKREHALPWMRKEIDKAVERLLKIRMDDPPEKIYDADL